MAADAMWMAAGWGLAGGALGWSLDQSMPKIFPVPLASGAWVNPHCTALVTSILFTVVAWRLELHAEGLAVSCLALFGVRLALIDIAARLLPTALVAPLYPATLALLSLTAVAEGSHAELVRGLLGMVILFTGYLAVALLFRDGLGAGDVRLAGPIGLTLGWHGWPTLAAGTMLAFIYAFATALTMLTLGRASRQTEIPFGPPMLAGALTAVLWR